MKSIDLRSDTVTLPTAAMRRAMAEAEVGDDVYGEDPTVNRLEAVMAERAGVEAGLFVASGTQGNLLGLLAHCERGDEYIVGQRAHAYRTEGGGGAALGGIQPQPLDNRPDGTLDLDEVRDAVKPDDSHYARSRLLCLENTMAGKVLPLDYIEAAVAVAREKELGVHLDGARVFNAAVKLGVDLDVITASFDTVSICLSKGLGAPVGTVLCGTRALIDRARRWRKVVGGGMRQAGIVAAAGLTALDNHVERLAQDHDNAQALARGLSGIDALEVDLEAVHTNMVFVKLPEPRREALRRHLAERHIVVSGSNPLRLVTHLDVSADDVAATVRAFDEFFSR